MKTALNCQGHMGLLAFMPHTSFRTHPSHHLPTAMARFDYNYTTGLPWKARARYSLVWQPVYSLSFFLPVSGYSSSLHWEQKLMMQYTGTTAGKASHIQLHFQRLSFVVGKASDKLAVWWHTPCYTGEAEICRLLWSLIIVVASGRELHAPSELKQKQFLEWDTSCVKCMTMQNTLSQAKVLCSQCTKVKVQQQNAL